MRADECDERSLVGAALAELEQAEGGAPSGLAVRRLVAVLRPVIRCRVRRTLHRWVGPGLPNLDAVIDDHVQHVFAMLFRDRAAYLRDWDPGAGSSLRGWVARFAERRMLDVLRSRRRDLRRHEATPTEFFARLCDWSDPERLWETIELWERVHAGLRGSLTARGRDMLQRLVERDESTAEVVAATRLRATAVRQWRRRLRARIQEAWASELQVGAG